MHHVALRVCNACILAIVECNLTLRVQKQLFRVHPMKHFSATYTSILASGQTYKNSNQSKLYVFLSVLYRFPVNEVAVDLWSNTIAME